MEELTPGLRHELRTPLNHLIGYGEMILESLADDSCAAEHPAVSVIQTIVARSRAQVEALQAACDPEAARDVLRDDRMLHELSVVSETLPPEYRDDLRRMQIAAEHIASFVANGRIDEPAGAAPAPAAAPEDSSRGRILAVDDNPENRELLRRMLERQNYAVTMAASGEECLLLIAQSRFDMVLLDVIMPGLSGFDVLSRLRSSPEWRTIPVIVISALDESSAAIRCIEMGAEDYLPKPFDPVLLRARIGAALEKKKLRDQEARHARDLEQAIDDLHRAQDRLVAQEKLASLGELTAGIAHELKNPLNFITNFSALAKEAAADLRRELENPNPDPAEIRYLLDTVTSNVERIENHGKRADRIVRGMLLHSRGQSGPREPADVNALVSDALDLARHGMRSQRNPFDVDIRTEFDPALPPVPARAEDISRVVVNIVNNAFEELRDRKNAAPDFRPELLVRTRNAGDSVEIEIEDNGSGIAPEVRERIFEPFFTTKPAGSGTGLGLSISFDIVRSHGGSLTVESEPGRFARFHIALPKTI